MFIHFLKQMNKKQCAQLYVPGVIFFEYVEHIILQDKFLEVTGERIDNFSQDVTTAVYQIQIKFKTKFK